MGTTKNLLIGALGVAAVLLLTSGRARRMREELEAKALENAEKVKERFWTIGNDTSKAVAEIREMLDTEVEGLSDDVRERLETILKKTAHKTNGLKKNIAGKLS